jgi:hypothetical protein
MSSHIFTALSLSHMVLYCPTLPLSVSHYLTLSHSHCPTLSALSHIVPHCLTLSHIISHCLTLSHIVPHCLTCPTLSYVVLHYLSHYLSHYLAYYLSHIIIYPTLSSIPHYHLSHIIIYPTLSNPHCSVFPTFIPIFPYFYHNYLSYIFNTLSLPFFVLMKKKGMQDH